MAKFLMNAWYCAAWARELTAESRIARRLLDIPVLLFRTSDGTAVALHDRCPHRFAPLSKGRREGDVMVCGYHGLGFDAKGQCTQSPFNQLPSPCPTVRTFPVVERYEALWFWPGDPAAADPNTIPKFEFLEGVDGAHGYLNMRANYEMVIDNLMDLSHIEFVHTGTFGGGGAFFSGQHSVEHVNDKQMWSRWWMPNVDPPIPMRQAMAGMKINHWQDMLWHAPSNFLFELGFSPTDVKREDGGKILQAHLLTPETERSTHYFYSGPPASMANPEMAEFMRKAFEDEDRVIIEAAQANMTAEFWEEKPLVLRTDAAAVQTRRALARLIREESGKPAQ